MAKAQSIYPGSLDIVFGTDRQPEDVFTSNAWDYMESAILAIETELGTDPAGASTDVKTLLAGVTAAEMGEIANIGGTTISATQWGMLGAGVEWTDWTPTLTGAADLSAYSQARYFRIGDICFFIFNADAKTVDTAGATIQITLPFTSANSAHSIPSALVRNNSNDVTDWVKTNCSITPNTNFIDVYKTLQKGAWAGTETGVFVRINGFFEII